MITRPAIRYAIKNPDCLTRELKTPGLRPGCDSCLAPEIIKLAFRNDFVVCVLTGVVLDAAFTATGDADA